MIKPQTLKGFRDFLPKDALKRGYVIDKIKRVFERYGFDPLETPALEYADVLLGKYGEEADKLLYLFEDNGGRSVGLRYDQTVPLARVIAQYQNDLPLPFKRYQIQPVWRAENTQKGRFREFLQCDADIIGDKFAPTADAEILTLVWNIYNSLGFSSIKLLVNSRTLINKIIFDTFGQASDIKLSNLEFLLITRALDKMSKIGTEGVKKELISGALKGVPDANIDRFLKSVTEKKYKSYKQLEEIDQNLFYSLQMAIEKFRLPENSIEIDVTLVRGLDYYTGLIFEAIDQSYKSSLGGGGRYDQLIGQFIGKNVSAVGFAIGFDRTLEAATVLNLLSNKKTKTLVLVTVIENWTNSFPNALEYVTKLRNNNINAEIYLNPQEPLDKQLKYADKKGIQYVIIQGPNEIVKNKVLLKNMENREQIELTIDDVIEKLKPLF